jgi:hypothetical protein
MTPMDMPVTALGGRALGEPEDRELLDGAVARNGGEEEEEVDKRWTWRWRVRLECGGGRGL